MDAPSSARSGGGARARRRGACLLAAVLLCALGVLTAVAARPVAHGHHHHGSIAAALTAADGQSGLARGSHPAVTGAAPQAGSLRLVDVTTYESSTSADQQPTGAARQRGPPAIAA